MHKVLLEDVVFYAHHGVYPEETIVGGKFEVNIEVETDFTKAAVSDDIEGTINYVALYHLVKEEMAIPSKLIEHLANRILERIHREFPTVQKTRIKISKLSPPISAEIGKVSVVIER